jgi:hypothetical protein
MGEKRNSSPDLFFDLDARNKAAQAKQTKQINTSQYKPRATSDLARTAANDSEQFRTVTNTIATSNEYIFNPKIPRMKRKLSRIFINILYILGKKHINKI